MPNQNQQVMAIVPARKGSKGLLKKNIRLLNGHPLIAYSIAAGLQAEQINRVICSTDGQDIAQCALDYGAEVLMRPSALAQDDTPDLPVFQHVITELAKKEQYVPDIIVHLRPTSPIRFVDNINKAIQMLITTPNADSVRSVCLPYYTPYKMWKIDTNGYLSPLLSVEGIKEPFNAPRQSLPPAWWQTGMIDVIRRETIIEKNSMTGNQILPIQTDAKYAVDIDSAEGLHTAERIMDGLPCIRP